MSLPLHGSVAAALLAGLLIAGCGAQSGGPGNESAQGAEAATGAPATPPPAKVTKLLVVVEENHSLAQMKRGMPYTFRLAKRYGYAARYDALTHPSLPNYVGIVGGTTHGIHDDATPAAHRLEGRSVFGQARAHTRSAGLYAQHMPRPCATHSSGRYAVKHNPWTYFVDERRQCRSHDNSMISFGSDVTAGALPRVGMVIPDLKHDAHDGTLKQADAWFRSIMSTVLAGPDWKSGHLAVVLTADEDDHAHGNRVLTVVVHPSQRHHVVRRALNHYSLTRLYDEVAHLPYLHHARTATSMARAFGLPVR
jgi:Phosphoesterase family